MTTDLLVPTAQYLRMSTEHQQYSIENQARAILHYASIQGFVIVRTYSDSAKSGLLLRNRPGLCDLLRDVTTGETSYRAILVYDVSRWGRFQDSDEAAHYEFLCKSAGIPIHYCTEAFLNDNSIPSSIMKTMKRIMAGEYSRELSAKVFEGHKRLAQLGFVQGAAAGYGLRRMLISRDGQPKQLLHNGECKNITTDRVILVHGPKHEVECVREIYRMFIHEGRSISRIARDLNYRGTRYIEGCRWTWPIVNTILTHPKYAGCHVYGRTSRKLFSRTVRVPKTQWVTCPNAFEPIIDPETFEKAQRVRRDWTIHKTDKQLLEALRSLFDAEGRLTNQVIQRSYSVSALSTYIHRFGSLRNAYKLAGVQMKNCGPRELKQRTQGMREELMNRLQSMFPNELSVVGPGLRCRTLLLFRDLRIAVLASRTIRRQSGIVRWVVDPHPKESQYITLFIRFTPSNDSIFDLYVFPGIQKRGRLIIAENDQWLENGRRLLHLAEFCDMVWQMRV